MSLEDLYRFNKLKKHKASPEEIKSLFGVVERCLNDASQTNISLDLRFVSTYQASLAAAEALLYCYGYEAPRNSYHYMTWEALRNIADDYVKTVTVLFNDAKQKRADAFYDRAGTISETEFNALFKETEKLVYYIKDKIKIEFPDFFPKA